MRTQYLVNLITHRARAMSLIYIDMTRVFFMLQCSSSEREPRILRGISFSCLRQDKLVPRNDGVIHETFEPQTIHCANTIFFLNTASNM